MVVFRLTQEEYSSLKEACKLKGGRNLSEFTRSELLAMLRSESIAALVQKRFHDMEARLGQLENAVGQLTTVMAAVAVAAPGGHSARGTD